MSPMSTEAPSDAPGSGGKSLRPDDVPAGEYPDGFGARIARGLRRSPRVWLFLRFGPLAFLGALLVVHYARTAPDDRTLDKQFPARRDWLQGLEGRHPENAAKIRQRLAL